jgi:hypothetical protein
VLRSIQRQGWKYLATLDEAWLHFSKQYEQIWLPDHEDPPAIEARHPLYSPDPEPSNPFLFGHVKEILQGTEFQTAEELLEAVVQMLSEIPLETLMATFHQWMERLQACNDGHGEYVE